MSRRRVFVTMWVLASTVPAVLGYATFDRGPWVVAAPYLVMVAVALGVLQGLVLEPLFGGGIFWKWVAVTVAFVIAAPYFGVVAGFLSWYGLIAVVTVLSAVFSNPGSQVPGSYGMEVLLVAGLAGGGIPTVLGQWLVIRRHVGRRWLWTLPLPGLTYGYAFLFSRDNWRGFGPIDGTSLLFGTGLALVYAVLTAIVIASALPERAATAVES
jgi:hypothetical protein